MRGSVVEFAPRSGHVESDADILARIRADFSTLAAMTRMVIQGETRGLAVTGAAGVGKTYTILNMLKTMYKGRPSDDPGYQVLGGEVSDLHVYLALYLSKKARNVLLLDDVNIFDTEGKMNMFKHALDTTGPRQVGWHKQSKVLADLEIPTSFCFNGGIIFVSNVDFDDYRSVKIKKHLSALESRCHHLQMSIGTPREKMVRIRQLVNDGMLDRYNLSMEVEDEIVEFIDRHKDQLRDMSLRTVTKAAELARGLKQDWKSAAIRTLCKNP
jgi:hypothetical protein